MNGDRATPYHRVARAEGLVPALTVLLEEVCDGALPTGAAGHAIVPAAVAERAERVWTGDVVTARDRERETPAAPLHLHGETLTTLRAAGVAAPADAPHAPRDAWELGLLRLRLGLSEGLRDHCLAHLASRTTAGTPLLQQQLVKGQLAEAATDHLEVRTMLSGTAPGELEPAEVTALHERITTADRGLLLLLGGSGFRTDGPGLTAHVSETLADAYTGVPLGEGALT